MRIRGFLDIRRIVFLAGCFLLVLVSVASMINTSVDLQFQIFGLGKYYIAFLLTLVLVLAFALMRPVFLNSFLGWSSLFVIFMLFFIMLAHTGSISMLANSAVIGLFWYSAFLFFYFYRESTDDFDNSVKFVFAVFLICAAVVFYNLFISANNETTQLKGLNTVYYILMAFPAVLLIKNILIRVTMVVIVGVATGFSLKVTALFAFAAALLVYIMVFNKTRTKAARRSGISKLILVIMAVVLLAAVFAIVEVKTSGYLSTKLASMFESGGSGRDVIWRETWKVQLQSNPVQWIFGHFGVEVSQANGLEETAHDEFLEVLFRYGLLGLGVFVFMIFSLIIEAIKMNRCRYEYTASFAAGIVLLIVMSVTSHTITYIGYFPVLTAYFGYIMADFKMWKVKNYRRAAQCAE